MPRNPSNSPNHTNTKVTQISPIRKPFAGLVQSILLSSAPPRANSDRCIGFPSFFRLEAVKSILTMPIAASTRSHPMIPFKFADVRNLDQTVPAPVQTMTYADTGTKMIIGIITANKISKIQALAPLLGAFTGTGFAADAKNGFCISRFTSAASKNIIVTQAIPEKICCGNHAVSVEGRLIGSSLTADSKDRIASIVSPLIFPV